MGLSQSGMAPPIVLVILSKMTGLRQEYDMAYSYSKGFYIQRQAHGSRSLIVGFFSSSNHTICPSINCGDLTPQAQLTSSQLFGVSSALVQQFNHYFILFLGPHW